MPDPLINGRFSLYETPEGGYHIAWTADGDTTTNHLEVPAFLVRMAKAGAEGKLNPVTALKQMMASPELAVKGATADESP